MVSVVIPVRNGQETIREAVESALNQTKRPTEIIIINDGSTDETMSVVEKLMAEHPGIVNVLSSSERGTAAARNLGVEFAKGELIAFLDADDSWAPRKLERQMSNLLVSERLISLTSAKYFTNSADNMGNSRNYRSSLDLVFDIYHDREMPSVLSSWLMSKKTFEFIGPFDTRYTYAQDYEFLFRALKKGVDVSLISEQLTNYRINSNGVTTLHHKQQKLFALHVKVSGKYQIDDPRAFVGSSLATRLLKARSVKSGVLIRKALTVNKSKPNWHLIMGFFLLSAFMTSPREFYRKLVNHSSLSFKKSK